MRSSSGKIALREAGACHASGHADNGGPLLVATFVCYVFDMASQQRSVDYLLEQATGAGAVSAKPMFGEYGVYVDGKIIGLICDDQLYVKPTTSGRLHAGPVSEAPPYPGAKPHLLIEPDRWEDAEWLSHLLRVTAAELPAPKPRKPKRSP